MTNTKQETTNEADRAQKMQSLHEMISNAEKTIQGAKAMLLQLEGKKKAGRRRKMEEAEDGGQIVQGTFDGQIMQGTDGKQYPVPANYASKSKLVEGDMLKLTITLDGSFIYKQIGPIERKHALGIVTQDEGGNYYVVADGKPYRVLLASITYFKAEPGDESAIVTSRDIDSNWASLENIVQKAKHMPGDLPTVTVPKPKAAQESASETDTEKISEEEMPEEKTAEKNTNDDGSADLLEEWRADIEAIEQEIEAQEKKEKESA